LGGWSAATTFKRRRAMAQRLPCLKRGKVSDVFVTMKAISKRQLRRKPSLLFKLKPGETLTVENESEALVIIRSKRSKLSADDIHRELDRLCEGAPALDTQTVMDALRKCEFNVSILPDVRFDLHQDDRLP